MVNRKDWIAAGLGLVGLAGTAYIFSFKLADVSYGIVWSMVFPTVAAVAYGRRGALFTALGGLYVVFPFLLYDDGGGNLVTLAITLTFLYVHGWAAEKRGAGSMLLRYRLSVVQGLYSIAIIPIYLLGYRLLSPGLFPDSVTALFGFKEAAYGLVSLVVAEGFLTLSRVRRFLGLTTDESYKGSGIAMLGVLLSGCAFVGLLVMAEAFLLGGREGISFLERPAADILFIGWLVLAFLLGMGGKMASLLQKKMASDLRIIEEKDRYKHIFENIEDIYYESELDGTTLEISPSVERILGVKREAMLGRKGRFSEEIRNKLRRNGFLQNELTTLIDILGKERVLSVNARLVEDTAGKVKVIGIIRDVTELEFSRMELVKINQELEARVGIRTRELEMAVRELEDFSYTVSHDLKSPVRSIESYCQFVLDDHGDRLPVDVKETLGSIREICGDMIHFIQRLLEYAVVSKAESRNVCFCSADAIHSVIAEQMPGIAGRDVVIYAPPELPAIWGDPMLFRQIIANGLSNALKYTRSCPQTVIRISWKAEGDTVCFAMADNGIGFETEKAERIFDIFHKLHMPEEYEGAGIGLATVRKCAERQGGAAWITGAPNKGATLYVQMHLGEKEKMYHD